VRSDFFPSPASFVRSFASFMMVHLRAEKSASEGDFCSPPFAGCRAKPAQHAAARRHASSIAHLIYYSLSTCDVTVGRSALLCVCVVWRWLKRCAEIGERKSFRRQQSCEFFWQLQSIFCDLSLLLIENILLHFQSANRRLISARAKIDDV
jgi:hypothetical protein